MNPNDLIKKARAHAVDLDQASLDRLADARAMLNAGRAASAIVAGLHALEIRLKVLICKRLDVPALPPPFEFHELTALLLLTGLKSKLETRAAMRVKENWANVLQIAPRLNDLRYLPDRNWPLTQATTFLLWLEHPRHGVLTWLSKQK